MHVNAVTLSLLLMDCNAALYFDLEPAKFSELQGCIKIRLTNTALNNGLIKFSGALLFTSQDHQFIQTIATRIMEVTPTGLIDKITTYDEYLDNDELARKRQVMNMSTDEN